MFTFDDKIIQAGPIVSNRWKRFSGPTTYNKLINIQFCLVSLVKGIQKRIKIK